MGENILSVSAGLRITKHLSGEATLCLTAVLDETEGQADQHLAILRDFAKELSQKKGWYVELNLNIFYD